MKLTQRLVSILGAATLIGAGAAIPIGAGAATVEAAVPQHADGAARLNAASIKTSVLRKAHALSRRADALPAGGFGNGIFQVYENAADVPGAGQFTVLTGPDNPAGPGHNVLYGDGVPGTSYFIVRDVTDGVDYVQGQMVTHANEVSLDDVSPSQSVEEAGTTTSWSAGGLDIVQTVSVSGDTAADSRVTVTTKLTDFNETPHKYQIQYLWDTQIGSDDGPVVQPLQPGGDYHPFDPIVGMEQTVSGDAGGQAVVDNDRNSGSPTFSVVTSGVDAPAATPDRSQYVCWADAIFAPLGGYVTDATRDVSGPDSDCLNAAGAPDSAVEYLWSGDGTQGEVKVAASMRMSPPVGYASTLKAGRLSLGSASATLTDSATGAPIAGRMLSFGNGDQTYCTVPTDAQGKATCGGILSGLLGYDVTYAGDAIWAGAKDHGGLL